MNSLNLWNVVLSNPKKYNITCVIPACIFYTYRILACIYSRLTSTAYVLCPGRKKRALVEDQALSLDLEEPIKVSRVQR